MSKEPGAVHVDKINTPGRYGDGLGLWLQVSRGRKNTTKSWLFQFTSPTTESVRQLGLGALHTVSLEKAREKARKARELLDDGIDPIEAKKEARQAKKLEAATRITFADCAERYMAAQSSSWRNEKHREQWASTLKTYAYPVLDHLPVADIDTPAVIRVLEPIWTSKPETASRLRGRIERVLDWAKVRGYRIGENPAGTPEDAISRPVLDQEGPTPPGPTLFGAASIHGGTSR